MKKIKLYFVIMVIASLCIFAGCSKKSDTRREYDEQDKAENKKEDILDVEFTENSKVGETLQSSYLATTIGTTTYCFRKANFDERKAEETISKIESMLEVSKRVLGESDEEVIVLTDKEGKTKPGIAIIKESEELTFDDIFEVIKAKYYNSHSFNGEEYGAIWWYFEKRYGGENAIVDISKINELKTFFSDEDKKYLLDFNISYLEGSYVDQEDSEITKMALLCFVDRYVAKHGYADLIDYLENLNSLDIKERERTKGFIFKELGIEGDYTEFAKFPMKITLDVECPYLIDDTYCFWGFSKADIGNEGCKKLYKVISKIKANASEDFEDVLAYFKLDNEFKPKMFSNFLLAQNGFFTTFIDGTCINVNDISDYYDKIVERYAYYLLGQTSSRTYDLNSWNIEPIACYVANYVCENRVKSEAYRNDMEAYEQLGLWDEEKNAIKLKDLCMINALMYFDYFEECFGEECYTIDGELTKRTKKMNYTDLSCEEATALFAYIAETYGDEALISMCGHNKCAEAFLSVNKTLEEVYEETRVWLEKELKDYDIEAYREFFTKEK